MTKKAVLVCLFSLLICVTVNARNREVSPRELYYKVSSAMMLLMEKGEQGLSVISDAKKGNPFIWKDTYIFVYNCEKHILVSHPNKKLIGNTKIWDLRDPKGKRIMFSLCEVARKHRNGGWIEYYWPKKQTKNTKTTATTLGSKSVARKISFCIQVPGTPYQVAGGIYNDSVSTKWLNTRVRIWLQ